MAESQEEFDALVDEFNDEYLTALRRAAAGDDRWLVETFVAVRDFHDLLLVTHDVNRLEFHIHPYPITFQGNEQLFASLGFSDADVAAIRRFLEHYRRVTGRDFEAVQRD